MKSFFSALQFLTIIPIRIKGLREKDIARSMIYFPLAGLCIGLFLVTLNKWLSGLNFKDISIAMILPVALIFITGGLHLDGLSDTLDAILSRKSKEEMLAIMRDSRIGAMGALGMLCVVLLKIALLISIDLSVRNTALILMCVLSRWSLVLAMHIFPYARKEGKAEVFMRGVDRKINILSFLVALILAGFTWQAKGLFVLIMVGVSTYAAGVFIKNKVGGITGDTLGGMNELNELVALVSVCIL